MERRIEVGLQYGTVNLDASLPACCLYEKRGYKTVKHERWNVENGVVLGMRSWKSGYRHNCLAEMMKKLLIGLGIGIVSVFAVIGIGNGIAINMMPEYLAPIRVMSGGWMLLTLIIPFMILWAVGVSFKDKKGKINKSVLMIVLGLEMVCLVIVLWAGTRSIRAIVDMINGPTEKVVYYALIKEDRDWGYRRGYSTEYYLEAVSIEGETREKLRLRVIPEDLEEVEKVLAEAKWDYDIRAKYTLRYFENIGIVFEIEAILLE